MERQSTTLIEKDLILSWESFVIKRTYTYFLVGILSLALIPLLFIGPNLWFSIFLQKWYVILGAIMGFVLYNISLNKRLARVILTGSLNSFAGGITIGCLTVLFGYIGGFLGEALEYQTQYGCSPPKPILYSSAMSLAYSYAFTSVPVLIFGLRLGSELEERRILTLLKMNT
ncbi:hypothetical protein [Sanyastnella coralliicola]|uniref:hypothetical protein n=1 Tax=Sanyastnella coralliicola TaxID=3069118 RepID=UPI0027B9BA05|nr:hypothetical protein [Longitalea sp. SCSIO 12813]